MIAGVIENRLATKMKLQIDPTVLYTTTNGLYNAKKVYYKDLKVKTVYNTYVIKGLPAGPICNPADTAIKAAMNPKKHKYLYYRTDGSKKGTHVFTETFEEHKNANSTSKRKKRKKIKLCFFWGAQKKKPKKKKKFFKKFGKKIKKNRIFVLSNL